MKKLLITILIIPFFISVVAQDKEKVLSQADQFSARSGALIQKEFIEIGNAKALDIKIIRIKDLNSGSKISALRFEYTYPSAYSSDTYIATLDSDEIDGLIKSISNIQNNVFNTTCSNYTEYIYRSRGGFEFGAFYSKEEQKWSPFVKLDKYTNKSLYPLKIEDIINFLSLIQKAQSLL